MDYRSNEQWMELLASARESLFHLEVRDTYAEPGEAEPLRRFLDGVPSTYDKSDWLELVRTVVARGVVMSRIRVVGTPLSDYQRWLLTVTGSSVEAGEDIRYVARELAGEVPADDWWLIDERSVAFNLFDPDGGPAGAAITADPALVAHCRRARARLWELATPFTDRVRDTENGPSTSVGAR